MSCQKNRFNEEFFMSDEEVIDEAPAGSRMEGYNFFAKNSIKEWAPIISLVLTLILVIRGN